MTTETADAVVIGAGVIGAAVALELARSGRRVVSVDAGPAAGAGSTSASSSIIRFHYSTWDGVLTAWEAAALWERWEDHLGARDPDGMARFVKTGCLVIDAPEGNRATVLSLFDRAGIPYEDWDAAALHDRIPALDTGCYWPPVGVDDPAFGASPAHGDVGGFFTPDAGFVDDPMLAAHNLMVAAQGVGAAFRFRSRVVEVRRAGDRVAGVTLESGDRIDAPVVVNVGGPHSSLLNRLACVEEDMAIRTRPLRQEVHVVDAPTGFALDDGGVVVTDADVGAYYRPHPGGTLLIGGMEPACDPLHWVDDPDRFDATATVEQWEAQVLRVARRLPDLGVPLQPRGVAALYDVSDDWVPIYDRTSLEGFYVACGTSGNQFKNAPMAGRFLAALVEAADAGIDHDLTPVEVVGWRTGMPIDVGHFSRRRVPAATTGSVLG